MNYKHTNLQINLKELKTIDNVKNGNIEVPIILPDGYEICVSVATPQNLQSIMDANEVDFLEPEYIFIIVNELTEETIIKAINNYMETDQSGYWLKLHHFNSEISKHVFDELQTKQIEERRQMSLLTGLCDLQDKIDNLSSKERSTLKSDVNKLFEILDSDGLDF
jgi:hypothetical protein